MLYSIINLCTFIVTKTHLMILYIQFHAVDFVMGTVDTGVAGLTIGLLIGVPLLVYGLYLIFTNGCCFFVVQEKKAVVKETCGTYKETLGPGVHFFCPCASQ